MFQKILAPIKIKSALPPPLKKKNQNTPPKRGILWTWVFFLQIRKLEKAVAVSGVCSGVLREKLRESPGKIAGKIFPNREMLQILGFRGPGKANLPGTLGRHCRHLVPTFRAGCFLKSTVPAFSSFSEQNGRIFQVSIKWRTHFRPRNCGQKFYGHQDFSEC